VLRLFCTQGFGKPEPGHDVLRVDGHEFDPLIGRTYAELGTEARSMHKCQGTSQVLPLPGTGFARMYRLLDGGTVPVAGPLKTMFDGIDTSLAGLAAFAGADGSLAASLRAVSDAAEAGRFSEGLRLIYDLRKRIERTREEDSGHYEIDFRLSQKQEQFQRAMLASRGIRLEALADDGVVTPGQPLRVTAVVTDHGARDVNVRDGVGISGVTNKIMPCWGQTPVGAPGSCTLDTLVEATEPTGIYWSAREDAARYDFAPMRRIVPVGLPFAPSPFQATFELVVDGHLIHVTRPVEYRYSDLVAGEKRMEVHVVPAFGVEVTPAIVVVPRSVAGRRADRRSIRVSVTNNLKGPAAGTVLLRAPAGWAVTPQDVPVTFTREDEVVTTNFVLDAPQRAGAGEFAIRASFVRDAGSAEFSDGVQVVEYPHIRRRHIVRPATARLKVIDARVAAGVRVGYIMGVGDQVPQAIEQLGAAVHLIGPDELAGGDLATYEVIVTGVRAYERRADLRANNHRLLSYAERGGTVLVQYNKFEFNEAQYGPFPAKVSANRVTDEKAPVDVLVPEHPVFNRPNKIAAGDWTGWVQERGLYFLGDRDPRYVDLVRLTDPFPFNPGPKTGALVEARVGKGRWVYIGLGLWRQLPAGTDGAYRLFANLLSLQ
jgi:hypothetical protein